MNPDLSDGNIILNLKVYSLLLKVLYTNRFICYSYLNSETFLILIMAFLLMLYLDIVYKSLFNTNDIYPLISSRYVKYRLLEFLFIIPASTINGCERTSFKY